MQLPLTSKLEQRPKVGTYTLPLTAVGMLNGLAEKSGTVFVVGRFLGQIWATTYLTHNDSG